MNIFVDTSVWSLALRRDHPPSLPEIDELRHSLEAGAIVSTGLVLQELLQGFAKPRASKQITARFVSLPMLIPTRDDHVQAAMIRNKCRANGIQIGTIDALFAQLCIHYELRMLTTDKDFHRIAALTTMPIWKH